MAGAQKKARREGRLIVFIDESGTSERPTRVRTWALNLRCLRLKAIPHFVQRGDSYQRCWNNTSFDSRTTSPFVAVMVAS